MYGPDNRRVRKQVVDSQSTLTSGTYHVGNILELEGTDINNPTQVKRMIGIAGAGLVYNDTDETFYWILPDELGSTRMIVDEDGSPIRAFNYSVYGIPYTFDPGGVSHHLIYDHLFTGQYWDAELDLYNYHARFYDPSIARFLQVDPAHQGFSPYVYVGGMPDIASDPSGMFFISLLAGGVMMALGGGMASMTKRPRMLEWHCLL